MAGSDPIVSVVMVSYNHGRFLRRVMDSVFQQTMPNFEVIVVDNGSTDESRDILASYNDSRLQVIHQENLGLSVGYNVGIGRARGKFIAIGNSDDEWALEKLALQLKSIEQHKAGVSFSAARLVDDDSSPVPEEVAKQFPFSYENLPPAKMFEKFFFKTNFICVTSALIDVSVLGAERFDPSLIQLQDFDLWIRLVQKTSFVTLPDPLVYYRVRLDGQNLSLDQRNRARVLFELNRVYRHFFDNVDIAFFQEAFEQHLKYKDVTPDTLEFEKAFLFLKKQEPSIKVLGVEMIYDLMSTPTGRETAEKHYGMKITDIWNLSKFPVFADSQSMESALLETQQLADRLKATESELSSLRESMRQITSGKLWKLREKIYDILKRPRSEQDAGARGR